MTFLSFFLIVTATAHAAFGAGEMLAPVQVDQHHLRRQAKSNKVQVCHKTGNAPCPWKDLEMDDSALPGHLGHGDYQGTCVSTLCNDANMCTIDTFDDANCCKHETVTCPPGKSCDTTIGCLDPHEKCDDGNLCTIKIWDFETHQCENIPMDCSPISPYHECDPASGECVATCPDDGDLCTIEGWNPDLNACYTPVECPVGLICDPVEFGCFDPQQECEDNNMCTTKRWDPVTRTCVYGHVDCFPGQVCNSTLGCVCDDGNKCTDDVFDSANQVCTSTPKVCRQYFSCDPADGICKEDEKLVPCVAVIDEDDNDSSGDNVADWANFRTQYPDRPFCLLTPYPPGYNAKVGIPPAALSDPKFQVHNVTRDGGSGPADDWFTKCGLGAYSSSNVPFIGLFVDGSGSMTKGDVKNAYNKFLSDASTAGRTLCEVYNGSEDWIKPFITTLTPSSGSCTNPTPI